MLALEFVMLDVFVIAVGWDTVEFVLDISDVIAVLVALVRLALLLVPSMLFAESVAALVISPEDVTVVPAIAVAV